MAKTIPQLTDATTVNAADELIIQQGGTTKRATRNELMTFAATGTTTARLIDDRFADVFNVKDFGAVGNGTTDDRAAIQAAIDAAAAAGGGVVELDAKSYAINATLNVPSTVSLVGKGTSQYPPSALATNATFLAQPKTSIRATTGWTSDTPVISVKTAPAAAYTVQGVALSGFMIDCGGFAERGLDVVSAKHCRFTDLLIYRPTVLGILEDVLAGGDVTTAGNNATQFNTWDGITVWVGNTGSVVGWRQTGTSSHNVNQCTYNNVQIVHANGIGLDIVNADTNVWTRLSTYSFGIGIGCVMRGANLSEAAKYARNNTFVNSLFGGANAAAHSGTAQAGSTHETIVLASGANSTNSYYVDKTITLTGGTGAGQVRRISAYTGSTRTATVTQPWRTTPDNTTTYSIEKGGGAEVTAGQGTRSGTAQAGGASTIALASEDTAAANDYTNLLIRLTGGTGSGQVRRIAALNTGTKVATVSEAWASQPDNTSTYTIFGVGLSSSGNTLINNQSEGNGAGTINIESRASATHLDERFAHFCDTTEPSIKLENPRVFGAGSLATVVGVGKLSEGEQKELGRLRFFRQGGVGTESCRIDFDTYQSGSLSSRAFVANGLSVGGATDAGAGTVATTNGFYIGTIRITKGAGSPESNVTAPIGSLWLRTDGSTGTTLYIKESGSGNTGWIAK